MQYSKSFGYNISKLTLGMAQLGLDYSLNGSTKPDINQSLEMLNFALKAGINTLDTARAYGEAEQIVGKFIAEKSTSSPINIVTKFKISDVGLSNFALAKEEVYKSVSASLSALRISKVPICIFHKDKDQSMEQVMEVLPVILEKLVEDKMIEAGGISLFHPDEGKHILEHEVIKAIQVPMNVFDQRLQQSGLLQQMHVHQKLVFIRSIFLKGLFFRRPDQLSGNLQKAGPYLQILQDIAQKANMSIAQLTFSYVRDMKEVSSIVFGADNIEQVQQNIELLQGTTLDTELQQALEIAFQDVPESIITPALWN